MAFVAAGVDSEHLPLNFSCVARWFWLFSCLPVRLEDISMVTELLLTSADSGHVCGVSGASTLLGAALLLAWR